MGLTENFLWLNKIKWNDLNSISDFKIIDTLAEIENNTKKLFNFAEITDVDKKTLIDAIFVSSRKMFEDLMSAIDVSLEYEHYENNQKYSKGKRILKDFVDSWINFENEQDDAKKQERIHAWQSFDRAGTGWFAVASGQIHSQTSNEQSYSSNVMLSIWTMLDNFNKIIYHLSTYYSDNEDGHIPYEEIDFSVYITNKDQKINDELIQLRERLKNPDKASNISIYDFILNTFISNTIIEIPPYQRHYSWGKKQLMTLLEDLFKTYHRNQKYGNVSSAHYFGTILTNYLNTFDPISYKVINYCRIIDGQQRITSIIILFIVFRDIILKIKNNETLITGIKIIDDFFKNNWINEIKLCDDEQYKALKEIYSGANIKKEKFNKGNRIHDAYLFLRSSLNHWLGKKDENTAIKNIWDFADCIKRSFLISNQYFCNNCSAENEVEIFDSINTKGKTLSLFDRIKSLMFSICGPELNNNQNFDQLNNLFNNAFTISATNKRLALYGEIVIENKKNYVKDFNHFIKHLILYISGIDTGGFNNWNTPFPKAVIEEPFDTFKTMIFQEFKVNSTNKSFKLSSEIIHWLERYWNIYIFAKYGKMDFQKKIDSLFSYKTFVLSLASHSSNTTIEIQYLFLLFDLFKSDYDKFQTNKITDSIATIIAKWFMIVALNCRMKVNIDKKLLYEWFKSLITKEAKLDLDDPEIKKFIEADLEQRNLSKQFLQIPYKYRLQIKKNNLTNEQQIIDLLTKSIIDLTKLTNKKEFYDSLLLCDSRRWNETNKSFILWCLTIFSNAFNPNINLTYWQNYGILPLDGFKKLSKQWIKNIIEWNDIDPSNKTEINLKLSYFSRIMGNLIFLPASPEGPATEEINELNFNDKMNFFNKISNSSNIVTTFNANEPFNICVFANKSFTFKDVENRNEKIVVAIKTIENTLIEELSDLKNTKVI